MKDLHKLNCCTELTVEWHADTNSFMLEPREGESSVDPLQHFNQGPNIGDPTQGAGLSQAHTV